jgi:hypothetical protein
MLAKRKFFSMFALAALVAGVGTGLPSVTALAGSDAITDNAVIQATYRVKIGAFNLGTFKLTTQIDGTVYRMRGDGHFSILDGLLYKWTGTTISVGRVTTAGIQPSQYALSYRGGRDVEEVRMAFGKGNVTELQVVPDKKPSEHDVPIKAKQLKNVLDPMSAAFLFARSANTNGDTSICKQTVPVFDGRMRFDLKLTPKKRVELPANNGSGYSGPALVCKVKYVPLGGYRPDNPGVVMLSHTNQIEVWMVPMAGTGLYVPYKIVLPTAVGYGTATATNFQVSGNRRASLR